MFKAVATKLSGQTDNNWCGVMPLNSLGDSTVQWGARRDLLCLRIGPHCVQYRGPQYSYTATRQVPTSIVLQVIQYCYTVVAWVSDMRYLGVYLTRSRLFRCSLDHAKRYLILSRRQQYLQQNWQNCVRGNRTQLVKSKRIPVLLYGSEACELIKAQIASLDFAINRCFMKLFSTNNIEIVKSCQEFVCFDVSSVQLSKRVEKFVTRFHNGTDQYCSCI